MATNIAHAHHIPPPYNHQQYIHDYLSPTYRTDVLSFANLPVYGVAQGLASATSMVPRQYAFPAVSAMSQETSKKTTSGLSFAEHALRRKTPNGTIDAGYDATPVDKAIPLPATKHILVSSLPEPASVLSPRSGLPKESWQESAANSRFHTNSRPRPRLQATQIGSLSQVHRLPTTPPLSNYERWEFPGGLDSVLNQTLPVQPSGRYYLQHGSSIPTVLPTSLQAYPGPTASAGNEFYGRYSPNEAFVPLPYQPAPVRDGRYFPNASTNNWTARNHVPPNWNQPQNHSFSSQSDHIGLGFQANYLVNVNGLDLPPRNSFVPGNSITHSENLPPVKKNQQRNMLQRSPQNNTIGSFWPSNNLPDSFCKPSADFGTYPENALFQEKIFKWAHNVYVSLLTSIHKSRHINAVNINGHARGLSKPNIFPKPPRQPGSDFTNVTKNSEDPPSRLSNSHSSSLSDTQSTSTLQQHPPHAGTICSPSQRQPNQWLQGCEPRPNSGRLQSFSEHYSDRYNSLQRRLASAPYGTSSRQHTDPSSEQLAAVAALDVLGNFCERSNGYWIDGMLLAGCLAYGLGDYGKAFEWYQGVLARDSCHVEAMSNLAATLLALNHRDEALQHWKKAVKLRPSYFEAVEHLIGLLCGNQRTVEAVKVIEFVEQSIRLNRPGDYLHGLDTTSEGESETKSRSSSECNLEAWEKATFDYDETDRCPSFDHSSRDSESAGFGSSGFAIPGSENGRILALIHAKGNMLYSLNDNKGAAAAFEDAILIGSGRRRHGIRGLIHEILMAFTNESGDGYLQSSRDLPKEPILLYPDKALQTANLIFGPHGRLPGLEHVSHGPKASNHKAAVSTTSNSLLSLAKIYQDGLSNAGAASGPKTATGVRDILALYYLSLSLQPSPSTANNVGILLASVQQTVPQRSVQEASASQAIQIPGVVPGSGIALALSYYNYGLNLDAQHAHLYTNLGSLLKDIGQLKAAIKMYEQAVKCDPNFDIALANLANAVKDQGMVADAIGYYKRAVQANPEFAEAVCGLATALNSVCSWTGRGGIYADNGRRDRWHVDDKGTLMDPRFSRRGTGWMNRVVEIVDKQLKDGVSWGCQTLTPQLIEQLCQQLTHLEHAAGSRLLSQKKSAVLTALQEWSGQKWEGARIVRLIEAAIRRIGWRWYQDRYCHGKVHPDHRYARPVLPASLSSPNAPTVLPFHTFTAPLSAKQIRQISQRNALRISVLSMRSSWLPKAVLPPPAPPNPHLNVGYVSSDFNNHPLAHLMQSVFGLHNPQHVRAFCYATTPSDNSVHRQQIEREAPVFYNASSWSIEKLVKQVVEDGIHILVNLNGYTRGARNEVFAARAAPIQMSFMGFAGTLGADWCDYILADDISIPSNTLSPWRRNVDVEDRLHPDSLAEDEEDWVYSENIIFAKDTFFCCDHRQSAPDAKQGPPPTDLPSREKAWEEEQARRWELRKELFPTLSDNAVILGNFNQLYKVRQNKPKPCIISRSSTNLYSLHPPDRPINLPPLPPHPRVPPQRHSLAPPLPRPRRTTPPRLRARMDPRLRRLPHRLHRRSAQGNPHNPRQRR
jgi:tetratricopeptide (TPR) repeat protein